MNTLHDLFKPIKIIHFALCMGALLVIFIIKFITYVDSETKKNDIPIEYIGVAIGVFGIVMSRILFLAKTKTAKSNSSLRQKIEDYKAAVILQIAMLEGVSTINIIFYYIFKNDINFAFSIALLFLMVVRRPTIEDFIFHTSDNTKIDNTINEFTIVD